MRKLSLWLLILTSAMLLQCGYFQPKPTEECAALKHNSRNNKKAVVFVHGFIGTCQQTWDKFPGLLYTDEELAAFDVYSWSYPSGILGKQPSVRRIGQQLKTYLANVLSKYDEVYLISHSLGGLVVQHMVIDELQNGHASELARIRQIVFFGSPLQGHELNSLIRLVKPEYADIDFRSESMTALLTEWNERVYKPDIRPGDRNSKLKIPFTPVCGLQDDFINANECEAIYGRLAETVPGTHYTMKNPKDGEADSYLVVKRRLLQSAASEISQTPTQDGRTGIWVARMRGDDDQYSAQREIVQKLVFYLGKESGLKSLVEVRELTQEVSGTESEKEILARQLAQKVNASVLIWGEIASLLKKDEFFPTITIGGMVKGIEATIRLEPVTEIARTQEYHPHQPYTLRAAPERVREPIRLARYVVALQYFKRQEWSQAAEHFEALIQGGVSQNIHNRDLHIFAGYSNFYLHLTNSKDFLLKARTHLQSAKQSYETSAKDSNYPFVLNLLGITNSLLYAAGIDTKLFFDEAERLFTEASNLWKESGDDGGYRSAQANLGATYSMMADGGIKTQQNNQRAISILEKLLKDVKEDGKTDFVSEVNLGYLYMKTSAKDQDPTSTKDLQQAEEHFLNATEHNNIHTPWGTYVAGKSGLAGVYDKLMRLGVDEKVNQSKSITALEEVATIYQEHKLSENYADVQARIAQTYTAAALKEIDVGQNIAKAISALKVPTAHYKETRQWSKYADAQYNLAALYEVLFRHNIDGLANLLNMKTTVQEGIDVFHKYGLKDEEKKFKEILGLINEKDLGDRKK